MSTLKKNINYNTLLFGSSRFGTTNPEDVDKIYSGYKTYNFFVSSGNQYDNLVHIKWALNNYHNLKNIYIQIDWPESFGPEKKYLQYLSHPEVVNENPAGF